jgi:basic amino acid/polyamine antiporter, APA family
MGELQEKPSQTGFTYTRKSGLAATTVISISSITGAGIYVLIGQVGRLAGPATILAVCIDLVIAILIAGCYSELGSLSPVNGGSFVYIRESLGKSGLFIGWIIWLSTMAYGSLCAITAGMFVCDLFGSDSPVIIISAAIIFILLLMVFNMKGSNVLGIISNPLEIALLVTFIIGAVYLFLNPTGNAFHTTFLPHGVIPLLEGSALLLDIFIGFEAVVSIGEEIKNPKKNIPRATFYSLIISAIFYFIVIVSIYASVDLDTIINSDIILMEAVSSNSIIYLIIVLGGIMSMMTSVGVVLMASSRTLAALAKADFIDRRWGEINPKLQAPVKALMLSAVLMIIIVASGQVSVIASISNVSFLIMVSCIAYAVIKFRKTKIYEKGTFKMRFHPLGPIVSISSCIFLACFVKPESILITLGWFLAGLVIYVFFSSKNRVYGTIFMVAIFFISIMMIAAGIVLLIAGIMWYLFSITRARASYLSLSGTILIMALVFCGFLGVFVYFGHFSFLNTDVESSNMVINVVLFSTIVICIGFSIVDISPIYKHFPFPDERLSISTKNGDASKGEHSKITSITRYFWISNFILIGFAVVIIIYITMLLSSLIHIDNITIRGNVIAGTTFEFFYIIVLIVFAIVLLSKGLLCVRIKYKTASIPASKLVNNAPMI